jgi:pilus assembly protein CpaC
MIRISNPGAALAPFAALLAAAALAAAPSIGRAQVVTLKVPMATKAAAALSAPVQSAPVVPAPIKARPVAPRRLAPEPTGPGVLHIDLSTAGTSARVLNLPFGKSAVVDLPVDAKDVLVTNPAVADAVLRSRRRISVLGVSPGETDAVFFDDSGQRILSLDIRVAKDSSGLAASLDRLLPGSHVRVESMNDSLVLAGDVANAADADKAMRLAARFVAKPEQVVNLMSITGREQVMLKVRIVEMQRTAIKQLGFNLNSLLNQVGMPQYLFSQAASFGVNGGLVGGLTGGYKLDTQQQPVLTDPTNDKIHFVARNGQTAFNYQTATVQQTAGTPGLNQAGAMVQAFERAGLVRTLAEPNLTAISGESAKFLAGGEFPVPTGEDSTGRVTVEFKPYGVGLGFTPVVMSEGRISLKVSTEVSELTTDGAFTLATSGGSSSSSSTFAGGGSGGASLSIPGLKVRRAETTIELPSGGAMMIAGLLQQQTKQNLDAVPGMMNMPVLGALFRSRDYLSGETELVVIVTPYLVKSTSPENLQTPIDGLQIAGDLETDLLGKMNKSSHVPAAAVAGKTLQGPYGYVIE